MRLKSSSRNVVVLLLLLGICHSVYLLRPSALLKRAFLRRRLLSLPPGALNGTQRLKRQLFREDIPHHRPLSGNTYYLHAGFPHPSRWHEGPQLIHPNPNPITHHHLEHHRKPGLHDHYHDDLHHNNELNSHHEQHHGQHLHHNGLHQQGPSPDPFKVSLVHNQVPHTVSIQSGIVHAHGVEVDNSLLFPPSGHHGPPKNEYPENPSPSFPPPPKGYVHTHHGPPRKRPKPPKPHSEPEPYLDDDDYGGPPPHPPIKAHHNHHGHGPTPIPIVHEQHINQPSRKPKTVTVHYHPVTVGSIINFNEESKPVKYGPPDHVPGLPLSHPEAHKDLLLAIGEPFIKTPFLEFNKDTQYGPPNHQPGPPIGLDLAPMHPSYGPPVKEDPIPPYSVALPVLAHLHSHSTTDHHHHHHHHHRKPPKRHRVGRHHHHHHRSHNNHRGPRDRHHLHFHHIHHNAPPPPGALGGPFFEAKQPTYVVHGHVPTKFVSFHSPNFKSHAHSHHHQRTFWQL